MRFLAAASSSSPLHPRCLKALFSSLSSTFPFNSQLSGTPQELNHVLSAPEGSPVSSEEDCWGLVTKLCASGNVVGAMGVVHSLRDKRIHVSSKIYDFLLKMGGEQNNIDIVSQSFKELMALPGSMSSSSFSILAKAFSVGNDDDRLLMFIREISDLAFPRNVLVVNRILVAFVDCGQIDKALMIFGHMRNFKCEPDLVTYSTIMGGLGHCGRIDEMLHVFTSLQEANISPDVASFNTILNNLKKVGRLQLILACLKQMIQRGVQPDLRTYTVLIDSFGRSGNVEESLRLLEEMKCRDICPSIYIYRSLLDSSKKSGKSETAMKLWEEMNSSISYLVGPQDFKKRRNP